MRIVILTDEGWCLSPAYDINPSDDKEGLAFKIDKDNNAQEVEFRRAHSPTLCGGVSEQDTKKDLDGIGFPAARGGEFQLAESVGPYFRSKDLYLFMKDSPGLLKKIMVRMVFVCIPLYF